MKNYLLMLGNIEQSVKTLIKDCDLQTEFENLL